MQKYKFAFVSNSPEIGETVKLYSDPVTEEVVIRLATMEEAIPVARELLDKGGVDVILGGGGTGNLLAQTLGQPVIRIAKTHIDILHALIKARALGGHVGLTAYGKPIEGIELFEQLLSLKIRQIVFSTTEDLVSGISDAVGDGVRCIVGDGICERITASLGGVGILTIPSKEEILQALREARAIAAARRQERKDVVRIRTVLETIKEGVITVDNDGCVQIFNQMAADILGFPGVDRDLLRPIGKPLPDVIQGTGLLSVLKTGKPEIDQVRRVGSAKIVITSLPVVIDGITEGVVATFREASKIQDIDRKLREKLYVCGFVTRYTIDNFKGENARVKRLLEQTRKYAQTPAAILIEGETGTGKEILAHGIHNMSERKLKPFIAINCSALPETLLESELFGYEEGAFTGAKRGGRIGMFELANEGTIFLDEIADIPPSLQMRLLRVLEQKEIMRIGGEKIVPVDVRIISSSYKNLSEESKCGRFRLDLYFRLAMLKLRVPPLRERMDDVPLLTSELLMRLCSGTKQITPAMMMKLKEYDWPGNIRELDSLINRYVVLLGTAKHDDDLLTDLLGELRSEGAPPTPNMNAKDRSEKSLKQHLEEYERILIEATLNECQLSRKRAAHKLGISVNTLWRKLN
ncbi:MAG: sigma 54-interacting transcriptional regulator [Gammaproteobacteria bacterium]|nr:PAS domain-containing protein [Rhodocyclaceae bacterium]MBU3909227.1 sigma 54-interacting transcriptional regulator [Gammaproteobacteria bacterium]MBU4005613.1 sigma 54-interacting transcriptional regulator [Gammaproteobacteria bacterium]MBU4020834.1 sigma 54-interacting transcriptional regulator [Gammaproteobacteria bacterium]MBU4096653.1 sigma 54-interacting transcriptional regulator [Gammaproteobacteria bacterium]